MEERDAGFSIDLLPQVGHPYIDDSKRFARALLCLCEAKSCHLSFGVKAEQLMVFVH